MKFLIFLLFVSANIYSQNSPIKQGYHLQGEFIEIISCNKYIITETNGEKIEVTFENTECDNTNPNHKKSIEYLTQNVNGKNADVLLKKSWFGNNKVEGIVMYGCWMNTDVKRWELDCLNGPDNLFEELYRIGCISYTGDNRQTKRFIKKHLKSVKKKSNLTK
jgi:hypothetical protein